MQKKITYQNNCYLCKDSEIEELEGTVRDYPHLKILKCKKCGLVFLDNFDHIDETYYENSKMLSEAHLSIDKWMKENYTQNKQRAEWLTPLLINKIVLDFGCGEGGFLANIKPIVKACAGLEQAKILRERIVNTLKIQVFGDILDISGNNFDIMTMFHVIEHLPDPIATLKILKKHLIPGGSIIIETPNANDALLSFYNCKAFSDFTYWGCHLYLYTTETLRTVLKRAGFKVNYIKQFQRYPLSNHLRWLAKGKPNGHKVWECLNSPSLKKAYGNSLASLGICDTLIASVSKEENETNI